MKLTIRWLVISLIIVIVCSGLANAQGEASRRSVLLWNRVSTVEAQNWIEQNRSVLERGDARSLNVGWSSVDPVSGKMASSAVHTIATIAVTPEKESVTEVIHDDASDAKSEVRLGILYSRMAYRKGWQMRIGLAFDGQPGDALDDEYAEAIRDNQWKMIRFGKTLSIGPLRYHYSLTCENGKDWLRVFGNRKRVGRK